MTSRTKISQRTKSTVSLDYPSSQFWVFSPFHFYIWIKKKLTRFPKQSKAKHCFVAVSLPVIFHSRHVFSRDDKKESHSRSSDIWCVPIEVIWQPSIHHFRLLGAISRASSNRSSLSVSAWSRGSNSEIFCLTLRQRPCVANWYAHKAYTKDIHFVCFLLKRSSLQKPWILASQITDRKVPCSVLPLPWHNKSQQTRDRKRQKKFMIVSLVCAALLFQRIVFMSAST